MARVKDLLVLSVLVAVAAAVSCSGSKKRKTSDPYGTETQFCQAWSKKACNTKVITACGAKDVDSCVSRQTQHCLGLIPPNYDSTNAKICLDAVGDAFEDAKLTADEIKIVRDLQGDCSKLNSGTHGSGEACSADDECNNVEGYYCVKKATNSTGSCQIPVLQGGGFACGGADQACVEGFYCNGSNCIAKGIDGAECNTQTLPCREDYNCVGTDPYFCTAKSDVSGTCAADTDCKSGICAKPAAGAGSCKAEVTLSGFDPFCPNLS